MSNDVEKLSHGMSLSQSSGSWERYCSWKKKKGKRTKYSEWDAEEVFN
jgi:hypothetical protein